jgi:hypothetical protein
MVKWPFRKRVFAISFYLFLFSPPKDEFGVRSTLLTEFNLTRIF